MERLKRSCANQECKAPITHCNGFVKAGDVIDYEDGKIPASSIRELCGRCIFKYEENPASVLSSISLNLQALKHIK